MDNYNYPVGADTDDAPWNEEILEPVVVDCCVSYSLSKTMPVMVNNYSVSEETEREVDDDKHIHTRKFLDYHFDNTDFTEEFENDITVLGIPALLEELKWLAEEKIKTIKDSDTLTYEEQKREIKYFEKIIKSAKGWQEDEVAVCPE